MAVGNVTNPLGGQVKNTQSAANPGQVSQNVAASSANAAKNVDMTKVGNRVSPLGSRPPRFWIVFGSLVAIIFIAIFIFTIVSLRKKTPPSQDTNQSLETAVKAVEQSPVALPAIKEQNEQSNVLKQYFSQVSVHFQDNFMQNVPEITLDAYKKYLDAPEGEEKLEAARAFYIYLNNPGALKDDPSYNQFLADIKDDLENTLGRNLFGE